MRRRGERTFWEEHMSSLEAYGIQPQQDVHWDLPVPMLYEHTLRRGQGVVAHKGSLAVNSAPYTGRSPKDKYVVRETATEDQVWWGEVNHPMEPEVFDTVYRRVAGHLAEQTLYVQDPPDPGDYGRGQGQHRPPSPVDAGPGPAPRHG